MSKLLKNKPSPIALIKRYHLVMFVVVLTFILSVSILLLYNVTSKASGEEATPPDSIPSGFDQATIDRIEQLKTSDQPSDQLDFSQGRINPFGE